MKRAIMAILLALCFTFSAQAAEVKFKNAQVHDPSVMEDNGTYYVYGSHMQAAKSTDLQDWKLFSKLDKCTLQPYYAKEFKEALTFAQTGTTELR